MSKETITGVILAGGQSRRMDGNDKGMINVAGKPMIEHVIEKLNKQVGQLIINANRNHDFYSNYGYQVVADEIKGFKGPLAGMASCLRIINTPYMVTIPCDSPHIPDDLVERLYKNLVNDDADISVADNGERMQPVFTLMRKELLGSMLEYLESGERKIDRWFQRHKLAIADFSDKPDMFININSPEDLALVGRGMENSE